MSTAARSFAVRVLDFDLRKRGRRFVLVEFQASTLLCSALAIVVAVAAFERDSGGVGTVIGAVFFIGVAINSYAVVRRVRERDTPILTTTASLRDVVLFATATLIPGALAIALRG